MAPSPPGDAAAGLALLRSLLAGLSTSLGALIVLIPKGLPTPGQMAFSLGLAGGVMITVSVVELWAPELAHPGRWAESALSSAAGAVCFLVLGKLVHEPVLSNYAPKDEDDADEPKEAAITGTMARTRRTSSEADRATEQLERGDSSLTSAPLVPGGGEVRAERRRLFRLAMLLTLALTAHNFPEGLAVAVTSLQSDRLGLVVMCAIAVHNVPEGIAIAVSVLSCTGSRSRAFWMATLSGLAEPLGALVALTVLPLRMVQGWGMHMLLCFVAGVMSCVAVSELLPEALSQRRNAGALCGFLAGVVTMLVAHEIE